MAVANYTVAEGEVGKHGTLVGNTPDNVTFETKYREVEVLSRNGIGEVFFTVDGEVPTIGGAHCYALPAAIGSLKVPVLANPCVVKLISSAAVTYSVTRT